ncbi:MAG: hypothetical protein A2921_03740 [Candidatus Magasanikbacteria bacterium RIFCSPLOWO2_01_FULL_43_20b]|uniref:DUF3800 domain-containing protein n=1 Tax=Candidatus Magasanikbacteria bacterium RIFCSPLOWO2_12_FULL_43_12 TaxID=1798692 RepID=A0A1F6MR11_9BACT|nr:MAG: hypothetical protein A3C74_00045 [Candidatus Magasanikbacteria bacterium RIFCSPHIGHO2_02_FULL_44_13]OGH72514.1 MAG: hypothetical protein A3I93_04330 [Candidatus Magasanikbacteria bacterium RIFCSPLOWO2_02_FULL_43_22]OGH73685.1 MAG: hypothetical protein A2921_03740 [Candidatus Magasanikbacteria bacterium RIFCSPLOWO2_01_FULL_43_20b]OGH74099.1 MAG: hypothetical protein A3G00_05000 [Candidatus Magasanikbacteria bacterium RIFCSPLOWO2_12_FULL_43_12]
MYIFLDESGQFHKNHSDSYFVIGSFTIGDTKRTAKRFKSWCRSKFPKKIRRQSEIKFSDSGVTDKLRLKTIKYICNLDVRIRFSFIKKENIPYEYRTKTSVESGLLYTSIVGETLEMYLPTNDLLFHVFCDQRPLKGIGRREFVEKIKTHLLPNLPKGGHVKIEMVDSKEYQNIQIADWVVGGLACYLNKRHLGKEIFSLLKNNIIGEGKEMFKDYWENKYNKKPNRQD